MNIALSQTGDASQIHLEGAIDIGSAAELKAALLEALKGGKGILVSLDQVTNLDITGFQLLWAAGREANQAGVAFALAEPLLEPIRESFEAMGLDVMAIFKQV